MAHKSSFGTCAFVSSFASDTRGRQRLASIVITLACLFPVQDVRAQDVIVNPGVAEGGLSRNAIRAIFGMRLRSWSDGSPIKVFVLTDEAPLHSLFSKKILNIFPHQLRRAWDRLVYSGTGQAPIELDSEQEMRVKVASTPGAIGYLLEDHIDDSVRVVSVE